jgi:hypothetical protein
MVDIGQGGVEDDDGEEDEEEQEFELEVGMDENVVREEWFLVSVSEIES